MTRRKRAHTSDHEKQQLCQRKGGRDSKNSIQQKHAILAEVLKIKHDWKLCRHNKRLYGRSSGFTTWLNATARNDPSFGLPLPLPLSRGSRILQRHMTRHLCTARRRDCSSSLTTRLCISAVSSLVVNIHPVLCGRLMQHQPPSRIASLA